MHKVAKISDKTVVFCWIIGAAVQVLQDSASHMWCEVSSPSNTAHSYTEFVVDKFHQDEAGLPVDRYNYIQASQY